MYFYISKIHILVETDLIFHVHNINLIIFIDHIIIVTKNTHEFEN